MLFVEAEKTFRASKQGQQKFDYVIHMARGLLPKPIQLFVSESMLKEIVQLWFDGVKDLLDDGKLNNSEDVEEVSREDKINHTTELDDGTWTNYAETPHEARHTFETFLDNAGGNRKVYRYADGAQI